MITKSKKNYKINNPEPENKFRKEQKEQILKLSFIHFLLWLKISKFFSKKKSRKDILNIFYIIIKKGSNKSLKIIRKKKLQNLFIK